MLVGSLSMVKFVVIFILLVLMYTCRRVYGRLIDSARAAAGRNHTVTSTIKNSAPKKTTETAGSDAKKRRRRTKKAPDKKCEDRKPKSGNKGREQSEIPPSDEKVEIIKMLNRPGKQTNASNTIVDKQVKSRKKSGSLYTTESVSDIKECDKCNNDDCYCNGGGTLGLNRSKNSESISSVESKEGNTSNKNVEGVSEKLFMNAQCLAPDQDTACQNDKEPNSASLQGLAISENSKTKKDSTSWQIRSSTPTTGLPDYHVTRLVKEEYWDYPYNGKIRRKSSEYNNVESELPENRRGYPIENLRRQKTSDHFKENYSVVNGSFKRHQQLTDHRRRRGSSDRTSESVPVLAMGELLENPWHRQDKRRGQSSSDSISGSDHVVGEIPESNRNRPESQRRQTSYDNTAKYTPVHPAILENPQQRLHNRRRCRSYDNTTENKTGGKKPLVSRRGCLSDSQDHIESENRNDFVWEKHVLPVKSDIAVHDAEMNRNADCEVLDSSTSDKSHVQEMKNVNTVNGQETSRSKQSQFVIDPAVRERLLNPKYPVIVPERPLEHIRYRDKSWRPEHVRGANKSLVGGMFGRKWQKDMEKKELKRELKELAEEEKRKAELKKWGDNICPRFMVWGVCSRGDDCSLRHPSYRYLERPLRRAGSPESPPEKQKLDPNSYAAVLGKSLEQKKFFNEAVLLANSTTHEANETSFANVLVCSKQDGQTTKFPVRSSSYEEAWPSLGSSAKGQGINVSKQSSVHSVTKAWSTKKGPWILDEKRSEVDKLRSANDAIIAQELQVDEYAQMGDDYSHYPEEYNEEHFNDYDPAANEVDDNRGSIDSHQQTKVRELEECYSLIPSSPVTSEQTSKCAEESRPQQVAPSPCDICMDRPKDATLVCGHRFCYQCALQMRLDERVCAICRRCIVSVIKTYN